MVSGVLTALIPLSPQPQAGLQVTMAAEGLPVAGPAGGLPGWELEAWYQDLQEVLAAAEPTGLPAPWGAEQVSGGAGDALRGEVGQGVSVIWDWLLFFPVGGAIRDSPAVGPGGEWQRSREL